MAGAGRRVSRIAGVVAVLCGGAVLLAVVVAHTFDRADAGERATDLVRSELSDEGLAQHRTDFELATEAVDELYETVLPAFAGDVGLSEEDFSYRVEQRYPDVAALLPDARRGETRTFAEGILTNLEEHREDFEQADAIPLEGIPMTAGPWAGVGFAAILVAGGLWLLVRPSRAGLLAVAGVSLVAIVATIATSFPQKADAADELLDTLNVTPAIAADTRQILLTVGAAIEEVERRLYPDVAAELGLSRAQLDARIDRDFPGVAAAREEQDALFDRYLRRVEIRDRGLVVVPEAKRFPLRAVTWWTIFPGGLAAAAAAGAALIVDRRSADRSAGQP